MTRLIAIMLCLLTAAAAGAQLAEPGESPRLQPLAELYSTGEFARAKELGRRLLDGELARSERVRVLSYLGAIHYELGEFGQAVDALREALSLFDGSDAERASLRNDLGESERAAGELARARATLEMAREEAMRAAPDSELHARILNNVAGLHRDQGNFSQAESLLREALDITESLDEAGGDRMATAHLNLAEVLRFQSRYEEAEPHYATALEIARETYPPDHPYLVFFLNQYAVLLSEKEDFAAASALRAEALTIVESKSADYPVLHAMLLSDDGSDLLAQGRASEGVQRFEKVLSLRREVYAAGHSEIGVALAQLARAELLARAPFEDVQARASAALAILDDAPVALDSRADAHAVRGKARRELGESAAARRDFEIALDVVENLRGIRGGGDVSRAQFLGRHAATYDEAIDLALDERRFDDAFDIAERFRARALAERLALDREQLLASVDAAQSAALRARLESSSARLVAAQDARGLLAYDPTLSGDARREALQRVEQELVEASRALTAAEEELRAASPAWRALVSERPTASLARTRATLRPNERQLLYWVGPDHAWLLMIRPTAEPPSAFELRVDPEVAAVLGIASGPLRQESLGAVLQRSEQGFAAGPLFEPTRGIEGVVNLPDGSIDDRLHALWKVLVPGEAWRELRAADEVTIIPSGALHLLPFEALVTAQPSGGIRYWLDDGPPIRYADSATTLLLIAASADEGAPYPRPDVLSVNNPSIDPRLWRELPELPGTEEESRLLREAMGPARVELLSGDEATESSVRARCGDKRYLHLATHGVVDETTSELLAALAFARDDAADGRLQLFEIDQLDLRAQLAVLSACRTAAGRRLESEGVFALSRGFHVAGASRVVASLWSVSDASTARLVAELFTNIATAEAGGESISYATALRDAKRAVRNQEKWAQPFHWAPFILSGVR